MPSTSNKSDTKIFTSKINTPAEKQLENLRQHRLEQMKKIVENDSANNNNNNNHNNNNNNNTHQKSNGTNASSSVSIASPGSASSHKIVPQNIATPTTHDSKSGPILLVAHHHQQQNEQRSSCGSPNSGAESSNSIQHHSANMTNNLNFIKFEMSSAKSHGSEAPETAVAVSSTGSEISTKKNHDYLRSVIGGSSSSMPAGNNSNSVAMMNKNRINKKKDDDNENTFSSHQQHQKPTVTTDLHNSENTDVAEPASRNNSNDKISTANNATTATDNASGNVADEQKRLFVATSISQQNKNTHRPHTTESIGITFISTDNNDNDSDIHNSLNNIINNTNNTTSTSNNNNHNSSNALTSRQMGRSISSPQQQQQQPRRKRMRPFIDPKQMLAGRTSLVILSVARNLRRVNEKDFRLEEEEEEDEDEQEGNNENADEESDVDKQNPVDAKTRIEQQRRLHRLLRRGVIDDDILSLSGMSLKRQLSRAASSSSAGANHNMPSPMYSDHLHAFAHLQKRQSESKSTATDTSGGQQHEQHIVNSLVGSGIINNHNNNNQNSSLQKQDHLHSHHQDQDQEQPQPSLSIFDSKPLKAQHFSCSYGGSFKPLKLIGKGAFGEVFLCAWITNEEKDLIREFEKKWHRNTSRNTTTMKSNNRDVLILDLPKPINVDNNNNNKNDNNHIVQAKDYCSGVDRKKLPRSGSKGADNNAARFSITSQNSPGNSKSTNNTTNHTSTSGGLAVHHTSEEHYYTDDDAPKLSQLLGPCGAGASAISCAFPVIRVNGIEYPRERIFVCKKGDYLLRHFYEDQFLTNRGRFVGFDENRNGVEDWLMKDFTKRNTEMKSGSASSRSTESRRKNHTNSRRVNFNHQKDSFDEQVYNDETIAAHERLLNRPMPLNKTRLANFCGLIHHARVRREAHIMANVAHPNIITYVDSYSLEKPSRKKDYGSEAHYNINYLQNEAHHQDHHHHHNNKNKVTKQQLVFLEYVDNGDLEKKLELLQANNQILSEETIIELFVQIVLAVEYLHRNNILHRDLKTANILVTGTSIVKLSDFGTAEQFTFDVDQSKAAGLKGTPLYLASEVLRGEPYSEKADMYSLGVVLYTLCDSNQFPYQGAGFEGLKKAALYGAPRPLTRTDISEDLGKILCYLLHRNAGRRPTAMQVLQTPLMQKALMKYVQRYEKLCYTPLSSKSSTHNNTNSDGSTISSRNIKNNDNDNNNNNNNAEHSSAPSIGSTTNVRDPRNNNDNDDDNSSEKNSNAIIAARKNKSSSSTQSRSKEEENNFSAPEAQAPVTPSTPSRTKSTNGTVIDGSVHGNEIVVADDITMQEDDEDNTNNSKNSNNNKGASGSTKSAGKHTANLIDLPRRSGSSEEELNNDKKEQQRKSISNSIPTINKKTTATTSTTSRQKQDANNNNNNNNNNSTQELAAGCKSSATASVNPPPSPSAFALRMPKTTPYRLDRMMLEILKEHIELIQSTVVARELLSLWDCPPDFGSDRFLAEEKLRTSGTRHPIHIFNYFQQSQSAKDGGVTTTTSTSYNTSSNPHGHHNSPNSLTTSVKDSNNCNNRKIKSSAFVDDTLLTTDHHHNSSRMQTSVENSNNNNNNNNNNDHKSSSSRGGPTAKRTTSSSNNPIMEKMKLMSSAPESQKYKYNEASHSAVSMMMIMGGIRNNDGNNQQRSKRYNINNRRTNSPFLPVRDNEETTSQGMRSEAGSMATIGIANSSSPNQHHIDNNNKNNAVMTTTSSRHQSPAKDHHNSRSSSNASTINNNVMTNRELSSQKQNRLMASCRSEYKRMGGTAAAGNNSNTFNNSLKSLKKVPHAHETSTDLMMNANVDNVSFDHPHHHESGASAPGSPSAQANQVQQQQKNNNNRQNPFSVQTGDSDSNSARRKERVHVSYDRYEVREKPYTTAELDLGASKDGM